MIEYDVNWRWETGQNSGWVTNSSYQSHMNASMEANQLAERLWLLGSSLRNTISIVDVLNYAWRIMGRKDKNHLSALLYASGLPTLTVEMSKCAESSMAEPSTFKATEPMIYEATNLWTYPVHPMTTRSDQATDIAPEPISGQSPGIPLSGDPEVADIAIGNTGDTVNPETVSERRMLTWPEFSRARLLHLSGRSTRPRRGTAQVNYATPSKDGKQEESLVTIAPNSSIDPNVKKTPSRKKRKIKRKKGERVGAQKPVMVSTISKIISKTTEATEDNTGKSISVARDKAIPTATQEVAELEKSLLPLLPVEVKDQIAKYHNAEYGHLGLLKTMKAMRAHDIHLHDMTNAVAAYIKACDTCQKTRSSRPFVPAYATLQETSPFRSIHLDHIVNLPESTEGFKHILVMIDAFTGFVMLMACKSLEAKHVVSALADMFGRFGGPYEI
jgi:hypothetical protein